MSYGHSLQRDPKHFGYRFFGLTKEAADAMDPQHRQILEVIGHFEAASGLSSVTKVVQLGKRSYSTCCQL